MGLIAKCILVLTALGSLPVTACGQTPGTQIMGEVETVDLQTHGDTVTIRYRIRPDASTPEPFRALTLPLPAPAIFVRVDTVSRAWRSTDHVGTSTVARWASLGGARFEVSPSLSLAAIGVPQLADAWIEGRHEPFEEGTPQADSATADTTGYRYGARKIRIVGIGPRASTLNLDERLGRLEAALAERCRLGNVTKPGLCNSLTAKLSAAKSSIGRGTGNAATGQLGAFKSEISAQRGKGLDETTYWLLSALADVVIAGLPTR